MSGHEADVLDSDRLYESAMERANSAFLSALRGQPTRLREMHWSGFTTTTWQQAKSARHAQTDARVADHIAEKARIDGLRVFDRDPCGRCGVKGADHARLGCKSFARGA